MSDYLPFEQARELLLNAAQSYQRNEMSITQWQKIVEDVLHRSHGYVPDPERVHRAKQRALARELHMSTPTSTRSLADVRTEVTYRSASAVPGTASDDDGARSIA